MPAARTSMTRRLNDETGYQRCFVCGQRNPVGLKLRFALDDGDVVTRFMPGPEHQGFPGVTHGGILAALLDETLGRTGLVEGTWMMTGRFAVRYRAPAPIGEPITVRARVLRRRPGAVEAEGEALRTDGTVVAEATGVFVNLPPAVLAEALRAYPELARYLSD